MANTFKGRKFGRERDQREALMAGLSTQLILNHSIKTTLGKAKELRPHLEKLVTLAKKQTLASRRLVIARLDNNVQAGHYLVDVIVPSLSARNSGYLRIIKEAVSYTHLRAHETVLDLVCRLLLEKKKKSTQVHDVSLSNELL